MKKQFSESTTIFAVDVKSGQILWRREARESFRHNSIAIGGGKLFVIDRELATGDLLSRAPARRGEKPTEPPEGLGQVEMVALAGEWLSSWPRKLLGREPSEAMGVSATLAPPDDKSKEVGEASVQVS